jgi:hypothetical protein
MSKRDARMTQLRTAVSEVREAQDNAGWTNQHDQAAWNEALWQWLKAVTDALGAVQRALDTQQEAEREEG